MDEIVNEYRKVGDTLLPVSAQLYHDGSPLDLTGATIEIKMELDSDGTTKVNFGANAGTGTVVDATAGKCQYTFAAGEVDTAGTYSLWIRATISGATATYPVSDLSTKSPWKVVLTDTEA